MADFSGGAGGGAKRPGLDLSARLYAKSLHAGGLTAKAPALVARLPAEAEAADAASSHKMTTTGSLLGSSLPGGFASMQKAAAAGATTGGFGASRLGGSGVLARTGGASLQTKVFGASATKPAGAATTAATKAMTLTASALDKAATDAFGGADLLARGVSAGGRTLVGFGLYDAYNLSPAARALVNVGREQPGVHGPPPLSHAAREALQAMSRGAAAAAASGSGSSSTAASLLVDDEDALGWRAVPTFLESLCLSAEQLESLAGGGTFLYLKPLKIPVVAGAEDHTLAVLSLLNNGPAGSGVAARRLTCLNAQAGGPGPQSQRNAHLMRSFVSSCFDLYVTDGHSIDPSDYYTLSREGVTHFIAPSAKEEKGAGGGKASAAAATGGSSSVFVPLDHFEREYRLFHAVQRIPVFAKYRRWKAFTTWKKALCSAKRQAASQVLVSSLFSLNPTLRQALMRIQRLCEEVTQWGLFHWDGSRTYTLESFMQLQVDKRVAVAAWLTEFSTDVRALVRGACDDVLDAFLTEHNIRPDQKMTFMERAALRAACRRLTKFVSVADFMVRDTLLTLALQSTAALVHFVTPNSPAAMAAAQESGTLAHRLCNGVLPSVPADPVVRTDLRAVLTHREVTARRLAEAPPLDLSTFASAQATAAANAAASQPLAGTKRPAETAVRKDGAGEGKGAAADAAASGPRKTPVLEIAVSFEAGTLPARKKRKVALANGESGAEPGEGAAEVGEGGEEEEVLPEPELQLLPSLHMVRTSLRSLVYDAMVVVSAPPRLTTHPDLQAYTQAASDDGTGGDDGGDGGDDDDEEEEETGEADLTEMATTHPTFRRLVGEMFSCLDTNFRNVENFCSVYIPYARTYVKNLADLADLAVETPAAPVAGATATPPPAGEGAQAPPPAAPALPTDYAGPTDHASLAAAIKTYRAQIAQFDGIPVEADVGTVRLDSAALKQALTPSPAKCLESIRTLLPVLMTALSTALVNEVRGFNTVLCSSPTAVEPFVAKVETLEKVTETLPLLRDRETYVRQLAQLMTDNHWPLPDDLKATFRMLRDALSDLESAASKTEASLDEDTKKFAKQVEQAIPGLRKSVQAIKEKLDDTSIASAESSPARMVKMLRELSARMEEAKSQAAKFVHYQQQLKQPVATFEEVDEVGADLTVKLKLWEAVSEWGGLTTEWKGSPFSAIDADELGKAVQSYIKVAARSERMLPGNKAAGALRVAVEEFKSLLPIVTDLRSKALQPRHWDEMESVIGMRIDPEKAYTLGELLDMRVADHQVAISSIATKAVQEAALDDLMKKKVYTVWDACEFAVNSYKDSKEVFVLGGVDDVIAALDESLVTINTVLGSRYCAHIRTEVEGMQRKLILLSETLDEWLTCQKQWMYLETIFAADDIKRQLPEEAKKFAAVDRSWKAIMKRTHNNPNALASGTVKGLKETLVRHNEVLEAIQKSLEEYLETKRSAFPRFYFLSNDELLEILAQTRDPQAVQPHLRKCYDALVRLEFGKEPGSVDIFSMISPENEKVEFFKPLKARGNVEDWLTEVSRSMATTLNKLMKEGVADYPRRPRREWVKMHAGQVVATVAQIMWSRGTEEALKDPVDPAGAVARWYDMNVLQLADLTALVRSNLTKLERRIIVALVTTDVHARDIVEELRDTGVTSMGSFAWQQQLRYYWVESKQDVQVRQSNSLIAYGYEYQGATTRLVITPLTDRCWMTITGALNLKLGAAPAGPAGTGKTESSKDLAKALAIQCIVFNCSDQVDYLLLGKLFSGLAQSGAWTCLDEFNRIDIEVLSVVAQQLQQLRQGLLQGLPEMQFEGRFIKLKPHMVIITMNPGYAGRTELPDNLKVLFRPVSMMVPDYALIAEIILFAEGFNDAKNLSRKMTRLYRLSSEQLSQQPQYDFGMRAVKSVLVMAGQLKREHATLGEDVVLIRAMRDSNVPKFLADDLPLFYAIISDLFPGVHVPDNDVGELAIMLDKELKLQGLQRVENFMTKLLQLYETFNVRFGVVLVGPTGAGKTTCYKVLAEASTKLRAAGSKNETFQRVHMSVLNPKCITMGELYGEFNEMTQEWRDGLASSIMRGYTADETEDRKWTVFDGPIDALWIENMNTVLDDNQMLCLANGERIKLKASMRMLFEVGDLNAASPATVSRLGVVYLAPENLGWSPVVTTWVAQQLPAAFPAPLREYLLTLFAETLDDGLNFRAEVCSEPITTTQLQAAMSLCKLFGAMVRTAGVKKDEGTPAPGLDFSRPLEELKKVVNAIFGFAYVWSVGGSIGGDSQEKFDVFVRAHKTSILGSGAVKWPAGSVFEGFPDLTQADVPWKRWAEVVPSFAYDTGMSYFSMVVPTIDTVRFTYLLATHATQLNPVFLTGVTGTGKTVVIADFLNRSSSPDYEGPYPVTPISINFSARTSSLDTQMTIEAKLEKKKKTQYGAPAGRRVVVFVDDCNMPAVETYGAQPPIELLRQLVDQGGFYDRAKLFFKEVVDTVTVAAAAPPGGGRAPITTRFTRHFHMLCVPVATDEVFRHIFGSIYSGFVAAAGFSEECRGTAPKAVAATIEVFNRVRDMMRPTPAKSHYTFNLRDVSKVFQGLLMAGPKEVNSGDVLVKLWAHETLRVFHDRLINEEDKTTFRGLVTEMVARYFGKTGPGWGEDLYNGLAADGVSPRPLVWCDFLRPALEEGVLPPYEMAPSLAKLQQLLEEGLEEYNVSHPTQMRLVFFKDAVDHVARISRVLRQPRGNAMLVGVGGSGKQSLTRVACHLANMDCFTIELTRGYGSNEFREDLKKLMMVAGVQGKPIAFLFTDTQIVQEGFLEDVSNVLNTGEVPGLFAADEVTKIVEGVRPACQAKGIPDTRDNVYRLFVQRVRDNLHIVLAMSPVGSSLRVRCRQFPSLINCTTIDWFTPWPRDALLSVARRFLADDESLGDHRAAIAEVAVEVHTSVAAYSDRFYAELQRRVYTTPKSYLDLLNLYMGMLGEKRTQLGELRNTLSFGCAKLEETNVLVENLRGELTAMQPVLEQKSKDAAAMLLQVSAESREADKIKVVVEKDAAEVAAQTAEVAAVQADAQKDLDVALPALKSAEDALKKLDKKDITEVKSFAKPPPAVRTVMEAVCLLLGEKTDWDAAKSVLSRGSFMDELIHYDRDNVAPAKIKALAKYIEMPEMAVEAVARVSQAAKTLCQWVHAVDIYSRVAKEVEPKKQRLAALNEKLAVANKTLKEKQDALQAVLDKVAALTRQCEEVTNEKERLAHEAQLTKDRLERAGKLTSGLSDEAVRWKESVIRYSEQITNLLGDVLLSAACISYFGAFTGSYRAQMTAGWLEACRARGIPVSDDYSLVGTLGDPVQVRDWQIAGLPTDSVSTDNAILVTRGRRWPLMIDPQEQAKKWVKNQEAKAKLAVTRFSNPNWLRTLEACIRIGQPLLLEDCGEFLDPALEPVLQRAVFKQGGRLLIHLGDSDVDYDPAFKLYLTTKMPNPHYLPEVCIKVTVINFTVTMSGLVDQLMGAVVRKEKPEVERRKNDLVVSMARDKKQLKDLENKILKLLRESTGNILDDKVLIETLAESKEVSKAIGERLRESERTEIEINETRDKYRPVAVRGSLLYFVIADLALIDPMYQFSLNYFTQLYGRVIDTAPKSDNLPTRLNNLMTHLTQASYTNVCRGLFEAHKLLFSFLMCVQIMRDAGHIATSEWLLLLRGAGLKRNTATNPFPDILSEAGWNLVAALEEALPTMKGLGAHIADAGNAAAWRTWATGDEPQTAPIPAPWCDKLSSFQRLLVLKVWREEKLLFAVKEFVSSNLGPSYVESPAVSLADIFKDTNEATPVIFILSVGADPTGLLFQYAKQVGYTSRLRLISLGQGQGPRAKQLIDAACATGDWVLLQNCHLARSWMGELERIVDSLAERRAAAQGGPGAPAASGPPVNPDFRLFLTSMPADYFPVPVLQNGVKLTNEPPKGIRANLTRSLNNLHTWSSFDVCEGDFAVTPEEAPFLGMDPEAAGAQGELTTPKLPVWRKLAFGLCFFHAVAQERRKFGPLGFNIRYEINDSDLETSVTVLKMLLSEQPEVPWDALRYVTGQINYGGRVTDDWDRRCMMAILGQYYTPEILADAYKFSPSGTYYAPAAGSEASLDDFKAYVSALPLNDPPEVFGMNANANITNQRQETESMLRIALSLQPRTGGGGGANEKTPDQIVADIASEIERKLPGQLMLSEAGPTTFQFRGEHMDSLATVLSQEMARFNKLLGVMAVSLSDIQRAIRGEILMSDELDKMYTGLMNNTVPPNWGAVSYATLKPLASWVKDLHARVAFLRGWLQKGQPDCFWLSGLFFPQGFLTGVLQAHARKYLQAIDTLTFTYTFMLAEGPDDVAKLPRQGPPGEEDEAEAAAAAEGSEGEAHPKPVGVRLDRIPRDGVLIYGLFLDGARWNRDKRIIDDSRPGELFDSLPVIHFMPTPHAKPDPAMYNAPVYKTSVRAGTLSTTGISTNYVVAVDMPTEKAPASWILTGAAILTQLND